MGRRDEWMENEIRELLHLEAERVDAAGLATATAVRRARRRLARTAVAATAVAAGVAYGGFLGVQALASGTPRVIPAGDCSARWELVPPAGVPGHTTALVDAVAVARHDVWAVGDHRRGRRHPRPLIEHWDGESWRVVPGAAIQGDAGVAAVAGTAPDDVWAAANGPAGAVMQRWDGSRWSIVPTPAFPAKVYLASLAAVSRNDVWAVGELTRKVSSPVTLHWDGVEWEAVPAPTLPGQAMFLFDVAAAGPDDVWAVGLHHHDPAPFLPLAMHWDGVAWKIVTMPDERLGGVVTAVTMTRDGTAWVIVRETGSVGSTVKRWDGSRWTSVPTPAGTRTLWGVQALASNDVWVFGRGSDGTRPLIARWDGFSWAVASTPRVPRWAVIVTAMTSARGAAWAVGWTERSPNTTRPFVLRSCPNDP